MDITTMMMGSMPQAPIMGVSTAKVPVGAGSTGQAGESSGNGLLFAQLLGTTLQGKFPGILPTSGSMTPELAELAVSGVAQMPIESAVAVQAGEVGKDAAAQSAMQLLNGLKMLLSGVGNGTVLGQSEGKVGEEAGQLLTELQKLVDHNGSLTPSLQEQLRGVLNPAVMKKEEQLAVLVTDDTDAASGEQKASEMLTALIATLNSALKQNTQQNLQQVTHQVTQQDIQQAAQLVTQNGVVGQPVDGTNGDSAVPTSIPLVKPEMSVSQLETAEIKAVISSHEKVQPKAETFHNAALAATVTGKPVLSKEGNQKPESDTKPVKAEMPEIEAVEVVFVEEAPVPEQFQVVSQKQEQVVGIRQDIFRSESIQALSREGLTQQGKSERPVVETVTSEQIVSQVREKLEEHRITAGNGQVTIRLHPAELGELKINVRMDDQRLRVEIFAENRTVKDALMENVGSLKEALARQNVDMKQFDVSTGSRQFFNQGFREGRQQEQQFAASRQAAWLMGHVDDAGTKGPASWQPKQNALLDMMM